MKQTKRIISVVALLLAALMLFSACSVDYRKVDPGKYIQLGETTYKSLKVTVDRQLVTDDDVLYYINNLRYTDHKVKSGDPNQPGAIDPYDVLIYRTYIYDDAGNLVSHDFAVASKSETSDESVSTVPVNNYPTLPIGYGINKGLAAEIESRLLSSGALFQTHWTRDNNIGSVTAGGIDKVPVVAYLTYNSKYASSGVDSDVSSIGQADESAVKPVHFEPYFTKETGENDFKEAIYLGLKAIIEAQAGTEDLLTPGYDTDKEITIHVYPKDSALPSDAVTNATTAYINYNLDFEGATTAPKYSRGDIKVKLNGAVVLDMGAEGAFQLQYKFPADAYEDTDPDGKYTDKDGNEHNKNNTTCTVWVYLQERQGYTCPEYDESFIRNTLGFQTTEADVVKAHKNFIKKMLQDECDAEAAVLAKQKLWEAACNAALMIKEPKRNLKNYVKETLNQYKYYYYDLGYKNQGYKNFEEFLVTMYTIDGSAYTTQEEIENALYEEAKEMAKKNLTTYYLADAFGVRMSDEQLENELVTRGTAWVGEVVAEMKRLLDAQAKDADEEDKGASTASQDVQSVAQELLSYLSFTSSEEVPADIVTWEYYRDYFGEENLYAAYHLDLVAEELYKLNLSNITYNDIDYVPRTDK